jgi:hypothetical protein
MINLAGSLLRHGATAGGGALAAIGAVAADPLTAGVGAVLTIGGFLMSAYKEVTRHALDLEIERRERLGQD